MTAIIKRLLALATAFTLALSLVGCGVDVTGVSLNLPDTIEKGTTLVATPEYAFDGAAAWERTSTDCGRGSFSFTAQLNNRAPTHCSRGIYFCLQPLYNVSKK